MKEFEVRAEGLDGTKIFKVVQSVNQETVRLYFRDLRFYDIYIQEVPLTPDFKGTTI